MRTDELRKEDFLVGVEGIDDEEKQLVVWLCTSADAIIVLLVLAQITHVESEEKASQDTVCGVEQPLLLPASWRRRR